jgi:hypothetical protein
MLRDIMQVPPLPRQTTWVIDKDQAPSTRESALSLLAASSAATL